MSYFGYSVLCALVWFGFLGYLLRFSFMKQLDIIFYPVDGVLYESV